MKKLQTIISILLISFIFSIPSQAATEEREDTTKRETIEWLDVWTTHNRENKLPRILLIGNSVTRLYFPEVEKQLEGKAYVSRLSTSKAVDDPLLLDEVALIMKQYDFAIVHFNNGLHGWDYTEEEYARGLRKLYDTVRKYAPHAKLIWGQTTPIRTGEGMKGFEPRTERIKARNKIASEFFKDKPVMVEDLYSVVIDHPEYYEGGDGTHPNSKGVKALADQVAKNLLNMLER